MESFNSKWAVKASSDEKGVVWHQSEIHVLASLLSDWSEHSQTLGWSGLQYQLMPEHFSIPEARFFYEVMVSMRDRGLDCGEGFNIFFEEAKKAATAKPAEVFKACLPFLDVTTTNLNYWARNILDGYLRREFDEAVKEVAENPNEETRAKMLRLSESIKRLQESEAFGDRKFVMLHHAIDDFIELLEERVANARKGIVHLSSGFPSLDAKLKLGRGHFIVIGGRSGMGKTAFAFNVIHRMISAGNKVAFFSLEHTVMECFQNLAAIEASVSYEKMDDALELEEDDFDRITECMKRFQNQTLAISNRPGSTIGDIKAELEEMRRRMGGLDAVFIDHMHVIGDDKNFKSPREKLIFITAQLKAMASYFDAPVIALAQMNRDADKRQDKRPQVSDLKESGSIEQDADAILFVYRDSYYSSNGYEAPKSAIGQAASGHGRNSAPSGSTNPLTELICRKNRHGAYQNFTLHLDFNPKLKKFTDATFVG